MSKLDSRKTQIFVNTDYSHVLMIWDSFKKIKFNDEYEQAGVAKYYKASGIVVNIKEQMAIQFKNVIFCYDVQENEFSAESARVGESGSWFRIKEYIKA